MSESPSIWYRIGYTWERARHEPPVRRLAGLAARRDARRGASNDAPTQPPRQTAEAPVAARDADARSALDALVAAGTGALAARLLALLPERRRPGLFSLLRAGAAGAGAALARELADPLLRGRIAAPSLGPDPARALLAGAARGLLYGALLEPRLPGPPVLRGLVYGSVEYAVSPWGGLTAMLGEKAPHRHVPLLSDLSGEQALGEDTWADHVVFGLALALLYSSNGRARRGTEDDE